MLTVYSNNNQSLDRRNHRTARSRLGEPTPRLQGRT